MIIINCEQGSDEWKRARAGVITASNFKVARSKVGGLSEMQANYVKAILQGFDEKTAAASAGYKTKPASSETLERALAGLPVGDFSDAAKNLAFRLAIERISGMPLDEGYETWQMRRGHELEPAARAEHERQSGLMVFHAGFITDDSGRFGASADGIIELGDEKEGSEYKCLVSPEGIRNIILTDDISEFIDQVQGCMWISGFSRWHFGLFCPALKPVDRQLYWRVVERDNAYIEALERDMVEFLQLTDQYEDQLRSKPAARARWQAMA